jgi:DNA-binding NarL/FixJ family response regulator
LSRATAATDSSATCGGATRTLRTIVVLDEQPLWVAALAAELQRAGLEVVATALTPDAALALVREHQPDAFVLALEMPHATVDGPEFIRRTRATSPTTKIVALSIHNDGLYERAARAAGADAFCPKTAPPDEIVAVVTAPARAAAVADANGGNGSHDLTPRELEILELVARGFTNAAIAKRLWVTEWTVKFHLANTYRKLGVSNRTQAARYVLDRARFSWELERPA